MEKTTEEAIKETLQQKLEHVRKYNRDYYHAHKKASECEHCKKTYSSVSALRRHQVRNIKCQLLHERNTREKLQRLLQARGIADASASTPSEQEEYLTLKFSKRLADYVGKRQPDIFKNTSNQTDNV